MLLYCIKAICKIFDDTVSDTLMVIFYMWTTHVMQFF